MIAPGNKIEFSTTNAGKKNIHEDEKLYIQTIELIREIGSSIFF